MEEKEYTVTLKDINDLDDFYDDMETPGGNLYIPNRAVDCSLRKPISRNTIYRLTEEEANQLRNDPRVEHVDLTPHEKGYEFRQFYDQTSSNWDKSTSITNSMKNWGILRCTEGAQRTGWGQDSTPTQSGTAKIYGSGKNVDVVIVDGHIDPNHPEFAKNVDGTGGTRVIQYNWFKDAFQVYGITPGTYVYGPYDTSNTNLQASMNHGCHVAGIAAGNTQGWAKDANIYNIDPSSLNPNGVGYVYCFDFLKYWHLTKPINPATGRPNPTIMNNSWGFVKTGTISSLLTVRFRGVIYNGPFTGTQLSVQFGILNNGSTYSILVRDTGVETDIKDCINAGIVSVGAAGNIHLKISNYSGSPLDDYNNYIVDSSGQTFYMRGSIHALDNSVMVGSIDANSIERKRSSSATGPRTDVFAPGSNIVSSINSARGETSTANDARNANYPLVKYSGTSMAAPQVTGSLACILEYRIKLSGSQAVQFVRNFAKINQLTTSSGGFTDTTDILGAGNRVLFHPDLRRREGYVGSIDLSGYRPASGQAFPRTKIFRYGR